MMFQNVQKAVKSVMGPDRPMGDAPVRSVGPSPQSGPAGPAGPTGTTGTAGEVNLVLVYAPWCGHSKRMLPDYDRIMNEFNGKNINGSNVNILMYDSDVDKDKVKEYGVKGFPTLFIEKDGRREPFPHRTYDKISDYLNNL